MSKRIEESGNTYSRLTVVKLSNKLGGKLGRIKLWECICECGNTTFVDGGCLRNGNTKSCGCLQKDKARASAHVAHTATRKYPKADKRDLKSYRDYTSRIKYSLGVDEVMLRDMMDKQSGVCPICEKSLDHDGKTFHVDHDHETGDIRSLLCPYCNKGLGMFFDNPQNLERAVKYIRRHNGS